MQSCRIADVEVFVLRGPISRTFGYSQAWVSERRGCLVKVTAEDGTAGWGECFGPPEPIAATIRHLLRPLVLGKTVSDIHVVWEQAYNLLRDYGQKGIPIAAQSGIDIALHDLLGKLMDLPVYALLGGAFRLSVPAYATGLYWYLEGDEEAQLVEEARGYEAEGFKAMKMKVGRGVAEDARLVRAVREALRPETSLMIDANHAYYPRAAVELADRVEGIDWFEEPVPPEDLAGYLQVKHHINMAVAGGEAEFTRYGFRDLIGRRCVDIVQPDTCTAGGLSEARKILALATAHGVRYIPHVWGTAITVAANLHLIATIPEQPGGLSQAAPLIELDRTEHPFRDRVVANPPEVRNGSVAVPTGAGLGVEVDEEYVRAQALSI